MSKIKKIELPDFLKPYYINDLIRIGSDHDGGYLISLRDLLKSKHLISFGISFDWSFEKEFKEKNKRIIIKTFDGSVGFKYYRKNLVARLKKFLFKLEKKSFIDFTERLKLVLSFSIFFRFNMFTNKIHHNEKFVSMPLKKIFNDNFIKNYGYHPETIEIKDVFDNLMVDTFISIDIEGSEYDILQDLINSGNLFSGAVIEFHNVNQNLNTIEKFIKEFKLNLVHLHVNNFGELVGNIPSVIELTFSKYSVKDDRKVSDLPNILDQENNSNGPIYEITFL